MSLWSKSEDTICSLCVKKISLSCSTSKNCSYGLSRTISFELNIILKINTKKRTPFSIRYTKTTSIFPSFPTRWTTYFFFRILYDKKSTHVTNLVDLLSWILNGMLRCLYPHDVHLEQGSARRPLPVSVMTDCCCGGDPMYKLA